MIILQRNYLHRKLPKRFIIVLGAILSLDCFPERCALLESQSEFFKSIRRMVVGKYSVFYVIKGDVVIVTSILYSASDIEKRLLARIR